MFRPFGTMEGNEHGPSPSEPCGHEKARALLRDDRALKLGIPFNPRGLEGLLESRGRFEAYGLRCRDLHCFAGLRIAAHTCCTLLDFESSETDDLHLCVFLHTFSDGIKNCCDGVLSGALGCIFSEGFLDCFNKFTFIHDVNDYPLLDYFVKLK